MSKWLDSLQASQWSHWLPLVITLGVIVLVHMGLRRWFVHEHETGQFSRYREQFLNLVLVLVALLAIIIASPIDNELRGQLLSLFGIVISAAIALSSTTVLGNLLGGIMLRSASSMETGDFIRVNGHFGRVSQRGLLHVEIQTEDSDLTTLPNLYLTQNPFTVISAEGTFVSVDVSLGYELNQHEVEKGLLMAIRKAELEDGFVQIRELGDYSITYRASGKLNDAKQIVSARSRLRSMILDVLHGAGVEIVSPTFMNQRQIDPDSRIIPRQSQPVKKKEGEIEEVVFEKAEKAHLAEKIEKRLQQVRKAKEECKAEAKNASGEEAEERKKRLAALERREDQLTVLLEETRGEEGDKE